MDLEVWGSSAINPTILRIFNESCTGTLHREYYTLISSGGYLKPLHRILISLYLGEMYLEVFSFFIFLQFLLFFFPIKKKLFCVIRVVSEQLPLFIIFIYVAMLQLIMFYIIMSHSTETREVLITLHQS